MPQRLLSGLFIFRVLQIYTDNGIRTNMHINISGSTYTTLTRDIQMSLAVTNKTLGISKLLGDGTGRKKPVRQSDTVNVKVIRRRSSGPVGMP
jgi:hypothetical protein